MSRQSLDRLHWTTWRKRARAAVTVLLLAGVPAPAVAQADGTPVVVIVPFAAGGPTDAVARALAPELTQSLGQPVQVKNLSGIGGTLGTVEAAQAPADGQTLLLHHIGMATMPSLYRDLSIDPQRDFEPVGLIVDSPMALLSAPGAPIGPPRQFGPYVRANQAKLSMAYAGIGSASHLCGLLLASVLRVELFAIPYKGTGPALGELAGGRADLLCDQTTSALAAIRKQQVLAYGVTSPTRIDALPTLATTQELGLAGLQLSIWHALYAPRGTPPERIEALSRALRTAVASPGFTQTMTALGAIPVAPNRTTPAALRTHLAAETARWRPILIKAAQFAD